MIMPTSSDLFVDTSGWAVYLNSHDPLYSAVDAYVRTVVASQRYLVTTNYVITELIALLSSRYRLPRRQIITAINTIKNDSSIEIIHIEQDLDNEAWKMLEARLDKEWSLVDASSFVVMKQRGITHALTSDHHFTQAGFAFVLSPLTWYHLRIANYCSLLPVFYRHTLFPLCYPILELWRLQLCNSSVTFPLK